MPNYEGSLSVNEIGLADWPRYKELRIRSISADPAAFGGDLDATKDMTDSQWQSKISDLTILAAQADNSDIAVMTIENLIGDFGTTCWIGGCWVDSKYRGQGVLRKMFQYIDENAQNRNWQKQGLGVWEDNFSAIAAYAALGFIEVGDPKPSTSKPGKFYQRMIRESS